MDAKRIRADLLQMRTKFGIKSQEYSSIMNAAHTLNDQDEQIQELLEDIRELKEYKEPKEMELEGGGSTWWYVCPECHGAIDRQDSFCKNCGQKVKCS